MPVKWVGADPRSYKYLRLCAEHMDREELISNLVTVEMDRNNLRDENDDIQSCLLPPGAFPNTDAFKVKLKELQDEARRWKITAQGADMEVVRLTEEIEELKTSLETTTSYWTDKVDILKTENEQLKEEVKSVTAQFEHETKTGANSVLAHGDIEEWCLSVEAENKKLKEENEKLNDDEWVIDNHKALKYKVVLEEDYYLQHLAWAEENKKLKTVEKIIGENWGSTFKEAFEMIGVEDDLIESGFSTREDFE